MLVALLAGVQSAAGLTLNGGPIYAGSSPLTGSCTYSGNPCTTTGATVTCTSINAGAFLNLYYGLRNDGSVNGTWE